MSLHPLNYTCMFFLYAELNLTGKMHLGILTFIFRIQICFVSYKLLLLYILYACKIERLP